jgi:hypothetical protein
MFRRNGTGKIIKTDVKLHPKRKKRRQQTKNEMELKFGTG